ncbi:MAG: hypothetical protein RL213_1827 [Bacteroidota bacterium]|jgi:hypothetical protein
MKINWGFGITLAALSFVAFILSLVYRCSKEEVDLVSERYYENELNYQQRINSKANVVQEGMEIAIDQRPDRIRLEFPSKVSRVSAEGTIAFYKPDAKRLDFNLPISLNDSAIQEISIADLQRGHWQLQISWNSGNVSYYQEKEIRIN